MVSLSLFGSTARGEERTDSDIDIAVRFKDDIRGLNVFERLDFLKARLSALLGAAVDVVPEPTLPGPVKTSIDRDRRVAF